MNIPVYILFSGGLSWKFYEDQYVRYLSQRVHNNEGDSVLNLYWLKNDGGIILID